MPYIAWNALNILNTSHKTKDETGARLRRSMASFERKPHTSKCSNLTLSILRSTSFPGARLGSPGLCRSILHSDWLTPYCLKIAELDNNNSTMYFYDCCVRVYFAK